MRTCCCSQEYQERDKVGGGGREWLKQRHRKKDSLGILKFIVAMSGFCFRHGEALELTIDSMLCCNSGVYEESKVIKN